MRTGNPALNDKTFESFGVYRRDLTTEQSPAGTMTINGTAHKTMFLLALAMGTACFTWSRTFAAVEANPAAAMPCLPSAARIASPMSGSVAMDA